MSRHRPGLETTCPRIHSRRSRSTPAASAELTSSMSSASINATSSPRAVAAAIMRSSMLIRPVDRAPTSSDNWPRGNPPPSCASNEGIFVGPIEYSSRGSIVGSDEVSVRSRRRAASAAIRESRSGLAVVRSGSGIVSPYFRLLTGRTIAQRLFADQAQKGCPPTLRECAMSEGGPGVRSRGLHSQAKVLHSTSLVAESIPVQAPPAPEAVPVTLMKSRALGRILAAFTYRVFRVQWFGACTSSIGTWVQLTAQNWMVLSLTGSAFFLGLDSFLQQLPIMLFTLVGGVLADRRDRRRTLLGSQYVQMATATILAFLVYFDLVTITYILILSFTTGLAQAFGGPAYQSLVPSLVDKKDLPNAVALNSI